MSTLCVERHPVQCLCLFEPSAGLMMGKEGKSEVSTVEECTETDFLVGVLHITPQHRILLFYYGRRLLLH